MSVHWLPVRYSNHMGTRERIRAFLEFALRSSLRAASLPSDIVLATSTPLTIAIPGIVASRCRPRPLVFEVRDLWPTVPIAIGAIRSRTIIGAARVLERIAYAASRHIIALSSSMKDGITGLGVPFDKVTVIPNACDIERFGDAASAAAAFRTQTPWLQQRPMVLYAGALGRVNGVGYLARIACAMKTANPDVVFLVVGDGAERLEIQRLAAELGVLNDNFFMLPQVPKSDVPAILGAATIATSLVIDLPELWANSANKFFDALSSSTPVAINYRGWQADLLTDYQAGLVLDPSDHERAAEALVTALGDDEWLAHSSQNAFRLAQERFDRNLLAKQLDQVLRSVAAGVVRRHSDPEAENGA